MYARNSFLQPSSRITFRAALGSVDFLIARASASAAFIRMGSSICGSGGKSVSVDNLAPFNCVDP